MPSSLQVLYRVRPSPADAAGEASRSVVAVVRRRAHHVHARTVRRGGAGATRPAGRRNFLTAGIGTVPLGILCSFFGSWSRRTFSRHFRRAHPERWE